MTAESGRMSVYGCPKLHAVDKSHVFHSGFLTPDESTGNVTWRVAPHPTVAHFICLGLV